MHERCVVLWLTVKEAVMEVNWNTRDIKARGAAELKISLVIRERGAQLNA